MSWLVKFLRLVLFCIVQVEAHRYSKEGGNNSMTNVMCQIRSCGVMFTWQHLSTVGGTMVSWVMLLLVFAFTAKTDKCCWPSVLLSKSAYLKKNVFGFLSFLWQKLHSMTYQVHNSDIHNLVIFRGSYSIRNSISFFLCNIFFYKVVLLFSIQFEAKIQCFPRDLRMVYSWEISVSTELRVI